MLEEARRDLLVASARAWEIRNALSRLLEGLVKTHGAIGREGPISERLIEELVETYEEVILKIDMLEVLSGEVVDKIDEAIGKIEEAMKAEE